MDEFNKYCSVSKQYYDDGESLRRQYLLRRLWKYSAIMTLTSRTKKSLITTGYILHNNEKPFHNTVLPFLWRKHETLVNIHDRFGRDFVPEMFTRSYLISPNIAFNKDVGFKIVFSVAPMIALSKDGPPTPPSIKILLASDIEPMPREVYYKMEGLSCWSIMCWNMDIVVHYEKGTIKILSHNRLVDSKIIDHSIDDMYLQIEIGSHYNNPIMHIETFEIIGDMSNLSFYNNNVMCKDIKKLDNERYIINPPKLIYAVNDIIQFQNSIYQY